jgi:hypothetical protein
MLIRPDDVGGPLLRRQSDEANNRSILIYGFTMAGQRFGCTQTLVSSFYTF